MFLSRLRTPRNFAVRWLPALLVGVASCASPGGPPLPEIAQSINDTLEPMSVSIEGGLTARSVTVLGEVAEPGAITLEPGQRLTLVEAIARAGGHLKATAHMSSLVLVRWDRAQQQQLAWKFDARPEFWGQPQTIFLQPYDLIYIPNIPVDNLGIWVDNYIRRLIPIPISIPIVPVD